MDLLWLAWLSLPVLAHVLYGIPPKEEGGSVSLHNGDDFSSADEPPRPDRLSSVTAISSTRTVELTATGSRETSVEIATGQMEERPCWVVVQTPKTFIELAPESFEGYLQHEGLINVIERRGQDGQSNIPGRELYSKYTKTALNDRGGELRFMTKPVGLPIELVPMDEGPIRVGDALHIQLLLNSQPAADLQVRLSHRSSEAAAPSDDVLFRTDEDGRCLVHLDSAGLWRLHAISMTRHVDPQVADWESLWASLTFRL